MVLQRTGKGHRAVPYSHSAERLKKVFREIGVEQGWWKSELPIVLAVSGGVDSMALFWFFHTLWKGRIAIAHLNHGIRGESADKDQAFVGEIAKLHDAPLITESLPVPSLLRRGESLEDGARRIRYEFLKRAMTSAGACGVALAHTSDDSVESFLMNLFRGTGPRGLAGIPERRGPFFRPLLSFQKSFLRELLQYHCLPWREDLTNLDDQHTRNRVRNRLIPMLEREFNPRVKEAILGTAQDMKSLRREEERLQSVLLPLLRREIPFAAYACSLSSLRSLEERELRAFFRGVGMGLGLRVLSRERTENLCLLTRRSASWCFQWQGDISLFCSSDLVVWISPDILSLNSGTEPTTLRLEGETGGFSFGKWRFNWAREQAPNCVNGVMGAIFPPIDEVEVLPLSRLDEKPGDGSVPEWARPLFTVLRSGDSVWIPFWGGGNANEDSRGGVRFSAVASAVS